MSLLKNIGAVALGASVPYWWTALTSVLGFLAFQYLGARSVLWVSYLPSALAGAVGGTILYLLASRRPALAVALFVAAALLAFLVLGALDGSSGDYHQSLAVSLGTWLFLAASVAVPFLLAARSNKSLERTREG